MLLAIGTFSLLLLATVIVLVIWLAKSRERAIQAETATTALIKGKERTHEANKIMAEPVADESSWIRRAYARLRDGRDSS